MDNEDPHLVAIGWMLRELAGDPDLDRFHLVHNGNAHYIVQALGEMIISLLYRSGAEPHEVLQRWQREHLQRLIDYRQRRLSEGGHCDH